MALESSLDAGDLSSASVIRRLLRTSSKALVGTRMVSVYVWVVIGVGALFVAYLAFTLIKMYLDDRERRRREAEGGGPYSSSSDNENGYLGLSVFRDSKGNDAGGLEFVREGVDKGGINSAASTA
ncbi:hypothetical protein KRP22_013381 [Phytophthora ramorum]|nr:hypothetical protein KRP23_1879 [Phytophthora ramorum]KAH7499153.1 hypothetical protein KRP22_11451 [Phytophthora ramorum]